MVLHSLPGEEAQVDFGYIGTIKVKGVSKKAWIFVMSLSYSRYMYVSITLDQSVKTFIRCHTEAFRFFGGVPQTVKIDNLKAAIVETDFYEPTVQRTYAAFADYYEFLPNPCRVYTPTDKGKVELYEIEKRKLKPLPAEDFIFSKSGTVTVRTDCHIVHDGNFYSVPYTYIGMDVDVKKNFCQGIERKCPLSERVHRHFWRLSEKQKCISAIITGVFQGYLRFVSDMGMMLSTKHVQEPVIMGTLHIGL